MTYQRFRIHNPTPLRSPRATIARSLAHAARVMATCFLLATQVSSAQVPSGEPTISEDATVFEGAAASEDAAESERAIASIHDRIQNRELFRASVEDQFQRLFEGMSPEAKSGYKHLVGSVYLPSDFDEEVLKELDKTEHRWPFLDVPLEKSSRTSTWLAHGLAPRPDDSGKPLQYVVTRDGKYVMNCFACHGGNLFGATYPGSPNTTYALESLTEKVRKAKLKLRKPMAHMDVGSLVMPLGTTNGSSNAVMFGIALMNYRDKDLNIHTNRLPAAMTHHDMEAPPWWHFYRKHHIYIDGFAEKGHKGLMQFMLVRQNGPEKFRKWESDFRDVFAFLSELRPPKYPMPLDQEKALQGQAIFNEHCARCHGTYINKSVIATDTIIAAAKHGELQGDDYPEILVDIDDVGTDRVRLDSLTPQHRRSYGESWFANYGKQETIAEVNGYVAPPLDGVWASAPYLHNGSVPTLWHLLHPEERPKVWRRIALALDEKSIGLVVEELDEVPSGLSPADRRWYFDTRKPGKSAHGHDYPNELTENEKELLLEYLKSI